MKTALEIRNLWFRKANSTVAERDQTLKTRPGEPPWMEGFGKLRRLRKETQRIQARIDERFEVIEPEGPAKGKA